MAGMVFGDLLKNKSSCLSSNPPANLPIPTGGIYCSFHFQKNRDYPFFKLPQQLGLIFLNLLAEYRDIFL